MAPQDLETLFGDSPTDPYVNFRTFDVAGVKKELETKGYSIIRGFVPEKRVSAIRDAWLDIFKKEPAGRITWAPYLGQSNHLGFSADTFQNLYRASDFYWNEPLNDDSRKIGERMNALRNLVLGKDPMYGLRFTDGRYGIFLTASYYPAGKGFMNMHRDTVSSSQMLIHGLVPLTFKGTDYASGGVYIVDRAGERVDVDAVLKPGDVVYYDGYLEHAVEPIVALPGKDVGRLQISPFPTKLKDLSANPRALSSIPLSKIVAAKLSVLKSRIRTTLGMQPSLR